MASNIQYVALPGVAADGNGDGIVDAADYVFWRKTFSNTGVTPCSGADGDTIANDDNARAARFSSTGPGTASAALTVDASAPDPVGLVNEPVAASGAAPLAFDSGATSLVGLATITTPSDLFVPTPLLDAALETRANWRAFGRRYYQQVCQRLEATANRNDLLVLAMDGLGNLRRQDVPATIDHQSRDPHVNDRDGQRRVDEPSAGALEAWPCANGLFNDWFSAIAGAAF